MAVTVDPGLSTLNFELSTFREHEPLARYSSWRIGGPARFFAEATNAAQLRDLVRWAEQQRMPWHLLGGGSNTLIADAGYAGLVVRYRAQQVQLTVDGDTALVRLDAGARTAGTARQLARQGWAGLEWAEGVPGTIGGAVYGNAGCYGGDIAGSLRRAWLLVGDEIEEWDAQRMAYGYRTSALKTRVGDRWSVAPIILAAEFELTRVDQTLMAARLDTIATQRRGKTPPGNSCGSVFKNPPGQSAGQLIEAAGLKGTQIGGAQIAQQHANYIVNRGDATSDDVLRLIELARTTVLRETGVALQTEVEVLG